MQWIALVAALAALGYAGVLVALSLRSRRAPELGLVDGRLRPCLSRANCIHTEDTARGHPEAPFELAGDPEAALDRLAGILGTMPRARLVERRPGYLRAEFESAIFRFVDDLEAAVDPAGGKL
jgi:uncharacterized protein (DUF1499 family)